jgi:hypothetical protein
MKLHGVESDQKFDSCEICSHNSVDVDTSMVGCYLISVCK